MICSAGMEGGSLVMADSVWPAMPPSTGTADPELPIPGEPEEPEAEGGGRGPCCCAIAGTVQAVTTTARKTTNRTDRKEILDSLTNFANRFICILRLELGLLPFRVWTHRLRLAKRLGGCTARSSHGNGI